MTRLLPARGEPHDILGADQALEQRALEDRSEARLAELLQQGKEPLDVRARRIAGDRRLARDPLDGARRHSEPLGHLPRPHPSSQQLLDCVSISHLEHAPLASQARV
jgi:hypothetical protein